MSIHCDFSGLKQDLPKQREGDLDGQAVIGHEGQVLN